MKWHLAAAMLLMLAAPAARAATPLQDLRIQKADGTVQVFKVERAVTEGQRERGLMDRTALPPGQGMLFLYEAPRTQAFWMKDTYIPLDMVFFTVDGTVAYIHPNAVPHDLTPIQPVPGRADICAVLEIAGGQAAATGLKPGDRMVLTGPSACLP